MKELLGYSFLISDTTDRDSMFEFAQKHFIYSEWEPPTLEWAEAWAQERIFGGDANPGESWKLRKKYWEQFLGLKSGAFSYTYNNRIQWQIPHVIEKLKHNKYMRGAMISVWNPAIDIDMMGRERIPCSIAYHLIVRPYSGHDRLWIFYYIRSQDMINHMPSDIFCATKLQDYIAEQIGVPRGPFVEYVDSLHAYRINVDPKRQW